MKIRLSEVCEMIPGYAFKSRDFGNYDTKVIKITQIEPPFVNMQSCLGIDISKYDIKKLEKYKASVGDFCFAMTGATIGKIGRIVDGEAYLNQRVLMFKPLSMIDKKYLYYCLCVPEFNKYVWNYIDSDSAQPNISSSTLGNFEIELPSLSTQRKIAAILSTIDDKIELNNKMNENLMKSIHLDVSKTLPFSKTDIIEGWKLINLSEIADFYSGYSYKGNELIDNYDCAMTTIKNFERGGGFKLDGFKEIIPSKNLKESHIVEVFDTLVAHTDLTQKAEVAGNAEIVLSRGCYKKLIMSMDLVKVIPKKGYSKFLIAGLLSDSRFKNHALAYVNGSTVLHMSKQALPEYELLIPYNAEILDNLSTRLEKKYKLISANINENQCLTELRDALLPKLMSGEIDVSKVEVD